ncbi:sugar transferase [Exiguobacterium sibiricum 255-15]|uniref:Sugar transferase n=1 Tax=Exiguobacterium sibiricum (strain DSM 17290 / CCUG 55495 / CIP 109462 / JCM 13490 / 255-15) TaxID=262543 RepID=B1YM58_EXIS2|nr:sugar transferase [Exiguobacterium sibiricum]ACB62016.1 sugar transferase [Exiguobacterium sibiricum 255-15]
MKRTFDFTVSLLAIIVLLPVYAFVAVLIYTKLGRPLFFNQVRPGYKGELFKIYKFRTMSNETDADGKLLPDADRIPKSVEWIRRLSLDEIPQFFNILRGQMSFVGPRPLLVSYLNHYTKEQMTRHDVLPGLTGWAQIHGRNATTWQQRLEQDQWYAANHTFRLDLYILWKTVKIVISSEGNSTDHQTGMGEFKGLDGGVPHDVAKQ